MSDAASRLRWTTVEDRPALPGLEERVHHPGFAGMEFLHVRAQRILNEVPAAAHLPFRWTLNAYRGCSHDCSYCFARPSHGWLDLDPATEFGRTIVVKVNAVERLRAELRSSRWRGEHVALGTNTDPYQRAEGRYRLMRGIVETLTEARNPYSVLTKGTLVTRDLDVLADAAARGTCTSVSFSIPTLDEAVWRATEPGAPHPRARLEAVAALAQAGVPAGVFVAPIMPGLTDAPEQLESVVRAALEAGASAITPIVLHLRPGVKEHVLAALARDRPELVGRYERLYPRSDAPTTERQRLVRLVRRLVRRHGGPAVAGRQVDDLGRSPAADRDPTPPVAEQLRLA
ncbi:radical SAM protein [Nitriliruptoraceae bacterium ZYF776]|nr:radical SAM protein [Profundirhabdus halotolerans]